jgi:hypothetical protein
MNVEVTRLSTVTGDLPSRTDMLYTKLGHTIDEIHELGRKMSKTFDTLGDCQAELESKGVQVSPEFPQHVLTALSVYRSEQQRPAAARKRAGA